MYGLRPVGGSVRDHTETTLRIVRGGIGEFDDAISWAINILDTRFSGATMVRFELEQYMVLSDEETDPHYQWNAVVSGLLEEK